MTILIATSGGTDSNTYVSLAEANVIMETTRLYTDDWFTAPGSDAEGYSVLAEVAAGEDQIVLDGGTGAFEPGCRLTIGLNPQVYEAVNIVSGDGGELQLTPDLVDTAAAGAAIVRLTPNKRERALIWATSLLDSSFEWRGTYRFTSQALRWPRSGVYDFDGREFNYDTIPELLKRATAELALALIKKDRTSLPGILSKGIKRAKLEGLEIEVDRRFVEQAVDPAVVDMLTVLGNLAPWAGVGFKVAKLVRG